MARTPMDTSVEMTETIVYLNSCLASGVSRFSQTCSARTKNPVTVITLVVTHP
jgi:hypothetical protein